MKVLVKHTVTEVKNLHVEINPKDILHKIYWDSLKDKPKKAEYIRDGYWYVHWFEDYHKGIDVEKKDRQATPEELKIHEAYLTLKDLI